MLQHAERVRFASDIGRSQTSGSENFNAGVIEGIFTLTNSVISAAFLDGYGTSFHAVLGEHCHRIGYRNLEVQHRPRTSWRLKNHRPRTSMGRLVLSVLQIACCIRIVLRSAVTPRLIFTGKVWPFYTARLSNKDIIEEKVGQNRKRTVKCKVKVVKCESSKFRKK